MVKSLRLLPSQRLSSKGMPLQITYQNVDNLFSLVSTEHGEKFGSWSFQIGFDDRGVSGMFDLLTAAFHAYSKWLLRVSVVIC